jgi:hypothetical protein
MNANKGLVESLAGLGPEAMGIVGASAPLGQFDKGTWQYWLSQGIPGKPGIPFKATLSPSDMQDKITLSAAWRDYTSAKAERDAVLQARGGMSMNAKANADVKAQWTDFTDNWMVSKYGSAWSIAFNDYTSHQATYLEGVAMVLNSPTFTEANTPMWDQVRHYMSVRQDAIAAKVAGADPALVNDQFEAWAGQFRMTSLDFADFFDNYLANDDLSIGVTPVGG